MNHSNFLQTKVLQTTKHLATPIMKGMFNASPNNYNWQNFQQLKKRAVKNGLETIS